MRQSTFGGVEAGGTKFVCAVGTGPDDIRAVETIETTTPEETLGKTVDFFRPFRDLAGIGIGSFGPVDPDPRSATFGYITSTPKHGWRNTDFVGYVKSGLGLNVVFDTDVNAAAIAEYRWGAAVGLDSFIYLTIGTGVGGGGLARGRRLRGLVHPEMGHLLLPRAENDTFEGICPFHGDCLEGMASGPAIRARAGRPAEDLAADDPSWEYEVHYLSMAMVSYICTLSPKRIVLGGGVMHQQHLFPKIRERVRTLLNGYIQSPAILQNMDNYIVPPALGTRAGVLGAIALAEEVLD